MKRLMIVLGVALALGVSVVALAQARPDFSGTWTFNQGKSDPNIAGNNSRFVFPGQIVVEQTPTELAVESTSTRQQPLSAVYKLDGSTVTVQAPAGISETGEARFEGATVVIISHRSFPSPGGEIVADFKETWSLSGNVLTIVKTLTQAGESTSGKAVFDKM